MEDRREALVEVGQDRHRAGFESTVSLLAVDPDLGRALNTRDFARASRKCRAQVLGLSSGVVRGWPLQGEPRAGFQGFLVLRGLLSRRVAMSELHAAELLGPGDLLRPWAVEDEGLLLPQSARWRVHGKVELAVLDSGFHDRAAAWPELYSALHDRESQRAHSLLTRLLIAQTPRITERVHLLLWHLAGRWGTVGSHGVLLPLRLSRALMAELVCTTRESMSRALTALAARGFLDITEDGFLLHDAQPRAAAVAWRDRDARHDASMPA